MNKPVSVDDWRILKSLCQDTYAIITNLRNNGVEDLDTKSLYALIKRAEKEILNLQKEK